MAATDILKTYREKGYASTSPEKPGEGKEAADPGKSGTPRIIKLSDDEQKAFAQAKPGEDLVCEVHGTMEEGGHFHVMSVAPPAGGPGGEQDMAGQVAQKVQPGMAI